MLLSGQGPIPLWKVLQGSVSSLPGWYTCCQGRACARQGPNPPWKVHATRQCVPPSLDGPTCFKGRAGAGGVHFLRGGCSETLSLSVQEEPVSCRRLGGGGGGGGCRGFRLRDASAGASLTRPPLCDELAPVKRMWLFQVRSPQMEGRRCKTCGGTCSIS
ncbi:hypothetical protein E2C01_046827 [Portunus trituberculatus]|uniref:Uncharacterized protein n=1 Tax=Portunus trituberculatus TaxID=210409 RepID=A0A5B7G632_PORTR|nr:hypothetical protein [Portunus trituberculatus]